MDITDILEKCGGIGLLIVASIQIAPIEINPISFLAKRLGNTMNEDLFKKIAIINDNVDDIKKANESLESKFDKRNADACRTIILRFVDELRRGVGHSEEFYNQILEDITDYENYCATHEGYKNGKAENAIRHIKEEYNRCFENDDFL